MAEILKLQSKCHSVIVPQRGERRKIYGIRFNPQGFYGPFQVGKLA